MFKTLLSILTVVLAANAAAAQTSSLWGKNGELWTPQGRLPDFSYAGYHSGNAPLPDVPVVKNVKLDFGARGDGIADDSDAFLRAIESTNGGALLIPQGRYKITKVLRIAKSGLVLRGEGPDKTILICPKPLSEISTPANLRTNWGFKYLNPENNFKFRGGIVWFDGDEMGHRITTAAGAAKRGDTRLQLKDAAQIQPGMWLRVLLFDDATRTLGRHLHADQGELGPQTYERNGTNIVDWAAQVVAVEGQNVTFDRPLRSDVRPAWKAEIRHLAPTVSESGVENLGFEFPGETYPGHLKERGFNAIYWNKAVNCWARNIDVTDADIAFNLEEKARFCTVSDVRIKAQKRSAKLAAWAGTGHHGIQLAYGVQDCLIDRFRFDTHYVHDISVDSLPMGNVFSRGSGVYLNFDHHRGAPFENLFTDLQTDDPSRLWVSSGQPTVGPPAGARETFWNIRTKGDVAPPKVPGWFQINVVGLPGYQESRTPDREWIEPLGALMPQNLHLAQLQRRRALQKTAARP